MIRNPLVIASPRAGFSLLILCVNKILAFRTEVDREEACRRADLARLENALGRFVTRVYLQTLERHVPGHEIIFNGEFHRLAGGVKWVDQASPELVRVRKYIGIRGKGDFLHVLNFPRIVFETYPVLHSHYQASSWLQQPHFSECPKLTAVRNPAGILNSACFSFNAMASEYIQRFLPTEDEQLLRQRNALYKLTDMKFFRGLVRFLSKYLRDYCQVRGAYFEMRWENLIQSPVDTILKIAAFLNVPLTGSQAEAIWRPIDHVQTLEFHQHNYRTGKGIVGDWKNSLVHEHFKIMGEEDLTPLFLQLGYDIPKAQRYDDLSPLQKIVRHHLDRGEIYQNIGDPELFGFAFNKSNIDASEFAFRRYPPSEFSEVERSNIENEEMVLRVSQEIDQAIRMCTPVLLDFESLFRADVYSVSRAAQLVAQAERMAAP